MIRVTAAPWLRNIGSRERSHAMASQLCVVCSCASHCYDYRSSGSATVITFPPERERALATCTAIVTAIANGPRPD